MEKTMGKNIGHYFKHLTCTLFVVLGLLGIFAPASQAATGAFTFSAATYSVDEGAGNVNITINRVGGSTGAATVSWRTNSATATFTKDYGDFGLTTLNFAAGETQKIMPIKIVDDTLIEANETFLISLSLPTNGTTLGSITSAVVTILDNDNIAKDTTAPTVALTSPANATTFTSAQTVTIAASAADNVGVSKVELYDGTVLKGTDTTAPYSFAWAITSANNGSHSLTAKAYDAAGNSKVSTVTTVTVNIPVAPVAAPGAFTFSAATYSVDEGAGNVNITINRVGGSTGAATVS
ncbi:MAG: Calx-beta domain-containing protein, partial [Desulfuromonadales bacterium]|nr:Calx-beta domain-containing protein [Desulfuromonadales bacterium]